MKATYSPSSAGYRITVTLRFFIKLAGLYRVEHAALDEEVEEVGRRLQLDVLDAARHVLDYLAHPAGEEHDGRPSSAALPTLTTLSSGTAAMKPMLTAFATLT